MNNEITPIQKLKQLLELSHIESVQKNDVLTLLAKIVIEQESKIEELQLTIDTLQRQIGPGRE